jgi:hypothetical protein
MPGLSGRQGRELRARSRDAIGGRADEELFERTVALNGALPVTEVP